MLRNAFVHQRTFGGATETRRHQVLPIHPVEVMETQGWKRATTVNLPWVKKMLKFLLHPADMVDDDDQVKEEPSSKKMRMSEERGAM